MNGSVPADEPISRRLRRLRLAAGLSQRELAGPGVSYAYISRIEAGTRNPSVKALRVLAERLGVTADYLEFGDQGVKENPTFKAMRRRIVTLEARVRELEDVLADQDLQITAAIERAYAKVMLSR